MSTPNEPQPLQGKRIIIRNLPPGTSREELRELGDKYGRVVSVELVPKMDRPFGFISFLTEDDALFTIYRLHGYRYKNNILEVSLSTSKPQPKTNRPAKSEEKAKKIKKPIYSLRTLTPLNPPTPSPQQQPSKSNDSPSFKSWQDHTHIHSPGGNNGNQLDQENGYVPPSSGYDQSTPPTTNSGGKSKPPRRNNNNNNTNNNNRRGKTNYKKIDHTYNETAASTDNAPPALSDQGYAEGGVHAQPDHGHHHPQPVPVTEVQISISGSQDSWHFKVGPAQWQEFLKAIDPFLQDHELH